MHRFANVLRKQSPAFRTTAIFCRSPRSRSLQGLHPMGFVIVAVQIHTCPLRSSFVSQILEYRSKKLAQCTSSNLRQLQASYRPCNFALNCRCVPASAAKLHIDERIPRRHALCTRDLRSRYIATNSSATLAKPTIERQNKLQTCDFTTLAACVAELKEHWVPAKVDQVRLGPSYPDDWDIPASAHVFS